MNYSLNYCHILKTPVNYILFAVNQIKHNYDH
jgi:hypothetical protein